MPGKQQEREKYKNKAEKSTWLVEDAWQATTNYKLKKERNTKTKQRNPLGRWDHATTPPRLKSLI